MSAPRRHLRLLAALVALGLLVAACGDDDSTDDPTVETDAGATDEGDTGDSGDDEAGSGDIPDPCTFLTLEDLKTLFDSTFDEGTSTDDTDTAGQRQCTWGNTDGPPVKVISITVATEDAQREVFPFGGAELFEQTRAAVESSITEPDVGLGDESFRTESSIYVLDGDTTYTFIVSGTSDEAIAGLKAMAEKVVSEQG